MSLLCYTFTIKGKKQRLNVDNDEVDVDANGYLNKMMKRKKNESKKKNKNE